MALTTHQPRISEGTRTARTLNQSLTPDPYLLQVGNDLDEYIARHRARPPLRLIKRPADQPSPPERADKRPADETSPPVLLTERERRITWVLLTAWCIGWLAFAVWWSFTS